MDKEKASYQREKTKTEAINNLKQKIKEISSEPATNEARATQPPTKEVTKHNEHNTTL